MAKVYVVIGRSNVDYGDESFDDVWVNSVHAFETYAHAHAERLADALEAARTLEHGIAFPTASDYGDSLTKKEALMAEYQKRYSAFHAKRDGTLAAIDKHFADPDYHLSNYWDTEWKVEEFELIGGE